MLHTDQNKVFLLTIASSFLLSSKYLGKINFIKFCYLFFDTIVFNSFWTVKNHKFIRFFSVYDFAALTVGKPTIYCDAPSPRQTKAFDAILRHVSPGTFTLQISKRNENEYGEGKKKMKRSLAWIFKRLERKSNKIVFRFVKVNKVKWMDPSPFALFPPPLFFRNGEKENSENIIISRNRKFRFDYRALLPECVLFIYVGAKDCGHKKCVRVRRGEFFRVIM